MGTTTKDTEVAKILDLAHQAFDGVNGSAAALLSDGKVVVVPSAPGQRAKDGLDYATMFHNANKAAPATRDIVVLVKPDASSPAGFNASGYGTKFPENALA